MIIRLFDIGFLRTIRKSGWCVQLTLLILLLPLDHTAAAEVSGRVVGITDGDTLTVLVDQDPPGGDRYPRIRATLWEPGTADSFQSGFRQVCP
jgi:endonuclease YncB( thermonuclease family)